MQNVFRAMFSVFLVLGIVLLPVHSTMAANETVVIAPDQTRQGSTFLIGDEVRIDGTIDGDLYVAAYNVTVNGSVNGDIIGVARSLMISGTVQGDVRALAQIVRLKGPVSGAATIGSESLYLEKQASIGRDLVAGCSTANLDGLVNGSIFGGMENLFLNGSVAKNVNVNVVMLEMADGASIGGNLTYKSGKEGYISENAHIGGYKVWKPELVKRDTAKPSSPLSIGSFLVSLAGILIIYWVTKKARPEFWDKLAQPARDRVLPTAAIGVLLLIATPILAVLTMITVVGIPLGIIMLITYGILLYVSKLVASIYLADLLKVKYDLEQQWLWFAVLVALLLVMHVPFVGWIISFAVLSLGLGCGFYTLFGSTDN